MGPKMRWLAIGVTLLGAHAQADERGRLLAEVYPASVHTGGPNHTAVMLLPDDRLAVTNGQGLLLFDGARWTMARHPERLLPLQDLARLPDGRLCGGFPGDVGCFEPAADGAFVWRSLNPSLPESMRLPATALSTLYDARRSRLVFVAPSHVLEVDPTGVAPPRLMKASASFARGYAVRGEIWLFEQGVGLSRLLGDGATLGLAPVPEFASLRARPAGIAESGERLMVLTTQGQLVAATIGAASVDTFGDPVDVARWRAQVPSSFIALHDGHYAIGFSRGVPEVIDAQGRVLERYTELAEVEGAEPRGMVEDRPGGLWIAQSNSVLRLDRGAATTVFGKREGLATAESVRRWRGTMYAASRNGLFRLAPTSDGTPGRFEVQHAQVLESARSIEVADDALYVPTGALYVLRDPDAAPERIGSMQGAIAVQPSRFRPHRLFVHGSDGVVELEIDRTPPLEHRIAGPELGVSALIDIDADHLQLYTRGAATWRATRGPSGWTTAESVDDAADARAELPDGPLNPQLGPHDAQWIATNQGVFRFDPASRRYLRPAGFPAELTDRAVLRVFEDADGNVWAQTSEGAGVAWREPRANAGDALQPTTWRWDESLFRGLNRSALLLDVMREGDVCWLSRTDGLVRIDLARRAPPQGIVLPRLVAVQGLHEAHRFALADTFTLAPGMRDLRVSFALPDLRWPAVTRFRSRLAGYENDWTPWSAQAEREFTNVPYGRFAFEVQARDSYGRTLAMPPWQLRVPAPWYLTRPAQLLYVLVAALLLWCAALIGARRRQRLMQAREDALTRTVVQRTAELSEKNRQLADQAERLTEVDRLKTRFFVNVGHEFRTPLSLVMGPIDDLLHDARERLSERARSQLELASRNARRVLDLVVELLDVNRLEQGRMRLHATPQDLEALVRATLNDCMPLIDRHGHRMTLELEQGCDFRVLADPVLIARALSNLVSNGAKFMARGGTLAVRLLRRDDEIVVEVCDQGRGIDAAALAHVFDRFFQSDGDDHASGYGIGLALVREIAAAHDGRIEASSTPGVGSTFTLRLPALAEARAPALAVERPQAPMTRPASGVLLDARESVADFDAGLEATAPQAAQPDGVEPAGAPPRQRVLVVDDHAELRARVRMLLDDRYEVLEAEDGPQAWRIARDELPDLLVCDVMMPGFDGAELARRLRAHEDTSAIGMLLLTAKVGSDNAVAGLRAGANDYLEKPFDSSELLARVEAILAHAHRLRLQLRRERAKPPEGDVVEPVQSGDERWRRRLEAAIAAHLDDAAFGVEALADAMHVDRTHLFRRCRELFGVTPSERLRDARLAHARDLLERQAGNVSEVAYASGFETLSGFTRAFKTRYGFAPSRVGRAPTATSG